MVASNWIRKRGGGDGGGRDGEAGAAAETAWAPDDILAAPTGA